MHLILIANLMILIAYLRRYAALTLFALIDIGLQNEALHEMGGL